MLNNPKNIGFWGAEEEKFLLETCYSAENA